MITLDELAQCLNQVETDKDTYNKVIKAAEELEEAKKSEKNSENKKKSKYKYTILVRGDEKLKDILVDGWIVKTKDDVEEITIPSKLSWAVGAQNGAAKRKKTFIETWSDAMEFLKRKFTKESECEVNIISKTPVRVVVLEKEKINIL